MISLKKIVNESREAQKLKSIKISTFPEKATLLDVVKKHEDEIWEYLWYDQGRNYEYGD